MKPKTLDEIIKQWQRKSFAHLVRIAQKLFGLHKKSYTHNPHDYNPKVLEHPSSHLATNSLLAISESVIGELLFKELNALKTANSKVIPVDVKRISMN